jgi:hypothetical protein
VLAVCSGIGSPDGFGAGAGSSGAAVAAEESALNVVSAPTDTALAMVPATANIPIPDMMSTAVTARLARLTTVTGASARVMRTGCIRSAQSSLFGVGRPAETSSY